MPDEERTDRPFHPRALRHCAILCLALGGCGSRSALDTDPGLTGAGAVPTGADQPSDDIFVPRQNGAVEVFVDDTRVYWVTAAENQVAPRSSFRSCLKEDCASTMVTYFTWSGEPGGREVAIDSAHVHWFVPGHNATVSAVESCPLEGCGQAPVTVVTNIDASAIASDGTFLYWTSQAETAVFRCSLGDCRGTQTALAQTQAGPELLVVSGDHAYWVAGEQPGSNAVRRVATDGLSPVETLATGQNQTSSLAVREPFAYFTNSDSVGTVLRCPVAGCPSGPAVVASGQAFPTSVVADDTRAYWIDVGDMSLAPDGSLASCPVGGCGTNTTTLAASATFWNVGDHAVAIDDQYVYWVTEGAAGDSVGDYGFPNAAIRRLAR